MSPILFVFLVCSTFFIESTQQVAPSSSHQALFSGADPGIQFELLTSKRGDGYGWNDCEFSPLSCLLRRRRRRSASSSIDQ